MNEIEWLDLIEDIKLKKERKAMITMYDLTKRKDRKQFFHKCLELIRQREEIVYIESKKDSLGFNMSLEYNSK